MPGGGESPFTRHHGPDKRLVRHVLGRLHQPSDWLPMNIYENECKLMEVRKYSAPYYNIDAKFRRPNLSLVTAYIVQNPFLLGSFLLRKEQMSMQLSSSGTKVKERSLYFPSTFKELELIVRHNFCALGLANTFYSSSEMAAKEGEAKDDNNPRIMIVARVITAVVEEIEDQEDESEGGGLEGLKASVSVPYFTPDGQYVDTLSNSAGTAFLKHHANECYPEAVLIYRDTDAGPDSRSSRVIDVIKYCQLSYRAGTRFNPDEITFKGARKKDSAVSESSSAFRVAVAGDTLKPQQREDQIEVIGEEDEDGHRCPKDTGAIPKRRQNKGTFAMSSSSRRYEDEADTNAAAETKVPLLSPEGVVIGDMEEGKKMKMADMGKRRRRKKKATFADGDEEEE